MEKTIQSYWEVIEPVWETINIYEGPEVYAVSISSLARHVVILHAAHFCQSEICNGGFLQVFRNSTGVLVPEGIEGFAAMGMPTLASLLSNAAAPLGVPYPRDRHARWDALLAASSGRSAEELEQSIQRGC